MIYLCTKKSGLRKSFKIFFSQNIFFELFSDDQPVPYTEHVLGGPNPPTRASDSANHASAHGTKCFEKFSKSPKKIGAKNKIIFISSVWKFLTHSRMLLGPMSRIVF